MQNLPGLAGALEAKLQLRVEATEAGWGKLGKDQEGDFMLCEEFRLSNMQKEPPALLLLLFLINYFFYLRVRETSRRPAEQGSPTMWGSIPGP